jgi:hypothetical protein
LAEPWLGFTDGEGDWFLCIVRSLLLDVCHLFFESVQFFEHLEIGFFLGSDDGVASFEFVLSGFKVAVFVTSLEA